MEKLTLENWKTIFRKELGFYLGDWDVSNYPKLKRTKNEALENLVMNFIERLLSTIELERTQKEKGRQNNHNLIK